MVLVLLSVISVAEPRPHSESAPRSADRPHDMVARDLDDDLKGHASEPLALSAPSDSGSGPLVTDRPDFTESTLTVPAGRLQIESGYTMTYNRDRGVRTKQHTYPELLVRVGLVDDVELRVAWQGWSRAEQLFRAPNDVGRSETMSDVETGGSDLSLGFKFHLADQDGWRPDLGVIVAADIPVGHNAFTSGDVDPFVGLLWAYDLSEDWAVAGNINFALPSDGGHRVFEPQASVSLGYSITDEVGAYAEYYGFYPTSGDGADTHYVNAGFTFLVTDDFQIDVRAGTGLNEDSDDFFTGVGFSWRF